MLQHQQKQSVLLRRLFDKLTYLFLRNISGAISDVFNIKEAMVKLSLVCQLHLRLHRHFKQASISKSFWGIHSRLVVLSTCFSTNIWLGFDIKLASLPVTFLIAAE